MTQLILFRRSLLLGLGGLGLSFYSIIQPVSARNNSPEELITKFHGSLIKIMREADTLDYEARFKRLKPTIKESFHLPVMLRIAVGDFWRKASSQQQERLLKVFTDISIGTYAARFSGYSGQTFLTKNSRTGPQDTILVETTLLNPSDSDIPLTYVTREIRGTWQIIDVLLSTGISELAVRRSEYRKTLKNEGVEGLIATLNAKVDDLTSPD